MLQPHKETTSTAVEMRRSSNPPKFAGYVDESLSAGIL
jgi:hypothetical protein